MLFGLPCVFLVCFCICYLQPMIPPKRLTFVHPDWGMLRRSRRVLIFFTHYVEQHSRAELQLRTIYSSCVQRELVARTLVVVVVVDSHIQRIVLATEETTVTQQVSHRPIKCQSRLWSQRGTKVNGSHHGDNPLLRPTGIQIATKSYAALQAMAPTNIKTVHQTSLLHIESNLDRLGMLSPTHDQRSQQKTGKITLQPVLINKSKFLKATHFVQK